MAFPEIPKLISLPEGAYDTLIDEMARFQNDLGPDHELGVFPGGSATVIHTASVRLSGQLIVFKGTDENGNPARLVQHYTQLAVQMVAVPKLGDQPQRIGF